MYGEEEDEDRRKKLEAVLKKAVEFIVQGPDATKGGLGVRVGAPTAATSTRARSTITQLQALRAARNAGIPVPKETIDKAVEYLRKCTTPRRRDHLQPTHGGARPPARSGRR